MARIPQEGAQRGRHELCACPVQTRCLVHDESFDVAGAQTQQRHLPVAETILQKSANERQVVQYRGRGKTTRFPQILLVVQHVALDRGLPIRRRLLGGDHPLKAQKINQVPERRRIAIVKPLAPSTISQVPRRVIRGEMVRIDALVFKPCIETSCQRNPSRHGRPAVSLLAGPIRKRIDPGCKRTSGPSRRNQTVVIDMLHGGLLTPPGANEWSLYYVAINSLGSLKKSDLRVVTRHSQVGDIVPPMSWKT